MFTKKVLYNQNFCRHFLNFIHVQFTSGVVRFIIIMLYACVCVYIYINYELFDCILLPTRYYQSDTYVQVRLMRTLDISI